MRDISGMKQGAMATELRRQGDAGGRTGRAARTVDM